MPKVSSRCLLLSQIDGTMRRLASEDKENTPEFQEMYELYSLLKSCRYMVAREPRIKNKSMHGMLYRYHDSGFRQEARMTKSSFVRLVDKLKVDPIFHNRSRNAQTKYFLQCMTALSILGCDGNGIYGNMNMHIPYMEFSFFKTIVKMTFFS